MIKSETCNVKPTHFTAPPEKELYVHPASTKDIPLGSSPLQSICDIYKGCHSPGMDQNQTLLSMQPWMQGARVEACNTEIQTQLISFLWYLVTEGTQ